MSLQIKLKNTQTSIMAHFKFMSIRFTMPRFRSLLYILYFKFHGFKIVFCGKIAKHENTYHRRMVDRIQVTAFGEARKVYLASKKPSERPKPSLFYISRLRVSFTVSSKSRCSHFARRSCGIDIFIFSHFPSKHNF